MEAGNQDTIWEQAWHESAFNEFVSRRPEYPSDEDEFRAYARHAGLVLDEHDDGIGHGQAAAVKA